jgi:hypothetical protein
MAERRPFLRRIGPAALEALARWAADDLRTMNGPIEFPLRRAPAAPSNARLASLLSRNHRERRRRARRGGGYPI